jgi:hypothetical protein
VTSDPAAQPAWLEWQGRRLAFDAAAAHSLALELDFDGRAPQWFGAPPPASNALQVGGFSGRVSHGASCNASTLSLTPHCDGTHTEGVGHLTRERHDVRDAVPTGFLAALLLTITPELAAQSGESTRPAPRPQDLLITRRSLEAAWAPAAPFVPTALIVRTLPNGAGKRTQDYTRQSAAFLSLPAAEFIVARGIVHLVLDVPSADRADDEGELAAHRVFFGLDPGANTLAAARRPQGTITELAYVPNVLGDGAWLMQLQIPALAGDALPSRPLLYRLLAT